MKNDESNVIKVLLTLKKESLYSFTFSECCLGTFSFSNLFSVVYFFTVSDKEAKYFILKLFTRTKTIFQITKKARRKEERKILGSSFICCLGDWIFYGPLL